MLDWLLDWMDGEYGDYGDESTTKKFKQTAMQVRAVTCFLVLSNDHSQWEDVIFNTASFCSKVAEALEHKGYIVQTLRLVTNPFKDFLDTTSEAAALAGMQKLKDILSSSRMPEVRIRFAIGAATSASDLKIVPALIQHYGDLANVCVNVQADALGVPNRSLIAAAAACVKELAERTPNGEGNFNFTANFNCQPLIPYFPAGYNTNMTTFALGLEYSDLLVEVLEAQHTKQSRGKVDWNSAFAAMQMAVQQHVDVIVDVARQCANAGGIRFSGLDSSPAPRKDVSSMLKIFKLLGCDFGGPGTIRCCSYLTKLFKSVGGVDLIGFSGLMLTCLEDQGMADAAAASAYNITMLNAYSAVCGIGLDCVPIPGDTGKDQIEALMGDTGTLAFRLNKPLTVRLFPCPGLKAGEMTQFDSADLCNCTVFSV